MKEGLQIRVRSGKRSLERFPRDDEALGQQLSVLVAGALARGLPRPAMLVLREEQVDWFDAVPILKVPAPHNQRMFAAISGQDDVECVALVGTFTVNRRGRSRGPKSDSKPQLVLLCFIEWPDNRWWASWRFIGEQQRPLTSDPVIRSAVDGWPRPGGVGGWFAMARRLRLKLKMERQAPPVTVH